MATEHGRHGGPRCVIAEIHRAGCAGPTQGWIMMPAWIVISMTRSGALALRMMARLFRWPSRSSSILQYSS